MDLSSNSSLGPAVVALVCKAVFRASLRELSLARVELDSSCTHRLALLHSQLQDLNLNYTSINVSAFSQLTALPWPQLHRLPLMGNKLTADAIASLVSAELPNLECLILANNQLHADATRHLATSNWLKLKYLRLEDNHLHLMTLQWHCWPKGTGRRWEC